MLNEILDSKSLDRFERLGSPAGPNNISLEGITILTADDSYKATPKFIDINSGVGPFALVNEKVNTPLRGSGVILHFRDDEGNMWEEIIQNHKGVAYKTHNKIRR